MSFDENYKADALKNIGYNATAKIVSFIFTALANVVLARNLTSDDYGIVGFASVFITFLSQFGDFGIGSAAIQKRDLDDKALHVCFTMKAVFGAAICIISALAAPLSQHFIENPAVTDVIRILALNFIINTFGFMPSTVLTRDLKFKWLVLAQLSMSVSNSLISIILALNGYAFWSIVAANIASVSIFTLVLNIIKPVKIKFYFNRAIAHEFMHFSLNVYASGFIFFLMYNIDNFLIGAIKGASALGYYSIAFNWGSLACMIIGSVVASVLFPTFAKLQQDSGKLRAFFLDTFEYILLAIFFASGMLFLVSEEFLYFVLGRATDKWMPAIAALQALCCYCVVRGIFDAMGTVILAKGNTNVLLRATLAILAFEAALIYPMLTIFDIAGVAVVVALSFVPAGFIYIPYYRNNLMISILDLWRVVRAPLAGFSVIIASAILWGFMDLSPMTLVSFFLKLFFGSTLFIVVVGQMTHWSFIKDLRSLMKEVSQKTGQEQ